MRCAGSESHRHGWTVSIFSLIKKKKELAKISQKVIANVLKLTLTLAWRVSFRMVKRGLEETVESSWWWWSCNSTVAILQTSSTCKNGRRIMTEIQDWTWPVNCRRQELHSSKAYIVQLQVRRQKKLPCWCRRAKKCHLLLTVLYRNTKKKRLLIATEITVLHSFGDWP